MTIALTVLGSLCSDFITVDNFMLLTVCNVWKHLILQHLKCRQVLSQKYPLQGRGRSFWTRNWKLKPNKNVAFSFLYIQAGKIEKLDQRLKRWRVIELRKQCFTAHKAAAALSLTSHCRWAGQSLVQNDQVKFCEKIIFCPKIREIGRRQEYLRP